MKLPPHMLALFGSRCHRKCHLCHQLGGSGWFEPIGSGLVCQNCHDALNRPSKVLDADGVPLLVGSFYETPLNHLMSAYKDHQNLSALMVLYHILYHLPRPRGLMAERAVIVPTPTTPNRLIKRGFYPVLTMAKFLSYLWQIPIWQGIQRSENTTHQRGLSREERLNNVRNDFYLSKPLSAYQVVIFDDVVTTGATLSAMAQAVRADYPKTKLIAVCALHGKTDLHLPVFGDSSS